MSIKHNIFRTIGMMLIICAPFLSQQVAAEQTHSAVNLRTPVIKTFPDGYRDDGIGSIFSDTTSAISFYLWLKKDEKPFTVNNARLTLEMPDSLKVNGFGVYRTSMEGSNSITSHPGSNGNRIWALNAGEIIVEASVGTGRLFPWTTSCIQVYVRPEESKKLPNKLNIAWKLSGDGMKSLSGTMKLETFPVLKVPRLKRFKTWAGVGMFGGSYNKMSYSDLLKMYRDIGINGIQQAAGGTLPSFFSPKELNEQGFSMVQRFKLRRVLPVPPAKLEKRMGMTLSEEDYAVNLNGERTTDASKLTNCHGRCLNYYCLTRLQDPSSPVFNYLCNLYKEDAKIGFKYFWTDYEHIAFAECFCPLCKKEFAKFAGIPIQEILNMKPLDLTAKYTIPWYRFRTAQIGMVLRTARNELKKNYPEAEIGYQNNFHHEQYFIPEFDSYGLAHLAEDPRILDPYLDFHNCDTIGSGLLTVYDADLYFQKNSKGKSIVNKPVMPRACGFIWMSWDPHVVFKRMERGISNPKLTGLGADTRPLFQKLEIANLAAIGASGIELDVAINVCDARTIHGVSKGLSYVAEFEDIIERKNRQKWDIVDVFDCTAEKSPYHEIGPKGFSGKFIYKYASKFGFVQFVNHKVNDIFLTSIFNWDLYQDKNIRVCFPNTEPGSYYISLYLEGEKIHYTNGLKDTWTNEDLKKGIGVKIPAGGICAIQLSPTQRPGYTTQKPAKIFADDGEKLHLYTWRQPKSKGSNKIWKEQCYNKALRRLIKKGKIKVPLSSIK